jgi:hypothetical protein
LHNGIAASLSQIAILSEVACVGGNDKGRPGEPLDRVATLARRACANSRSIGSTPGLPLHASRPELKVVDREVLLTVEDNGIGLSPGEKVPDRNGGTGIPSMRRRAEGLGDCM